MRPVGDRGLLFDLAVDAPALFGDLGEVSHPRTGNQNRGARLLQGRIQIGLPFHSRFLIDSRLLPLTLRAGFAVRFNILFPQSYSQLVPHQAAQVHKHPCDAGIIELAGDGRIDRHLVILELELDAVALPLLAHVAQRVLGAALVELVEHDQFREIDHVDLFELAGRAVVAGHHVHREIDEIDDLGIGLADACGLDDDEVVGLALEECHAVLQHGTRRGMLASRRHRAHEHAMAAQGIHADAIAQQRTAGTAPGRIDREHGDAHLRERVQEAQQQLIDHARLAGAAGARDADDRRAAPAGFGIRDSGFGSARTCPMFAQLDQFGFAVLSIFDGGEDAPYRYFVINIRICCARCAFQIPNPQSRIPRARSARNHILDHRDEAEVHAVVRVVDALDAVVLQFADFLRGDGAATAAEYADVGCTALPEHVDHVLEILDMAALVGRQRDRVGVLLQGGAHHVFDRSVVAEVDHLGTLRLDQPPHDVDRGVVAIEQARCRHEPQRGGVAGGFTGGQALGSRTHGGFSVHAGDADSNASGHGPAGWPRATPCLTTATPAHPLSFRRACRSAAGAKTGNPGQSGIPSRSVHRAAPAFPRLLR